MRLNAIVFAFKRNLLRLNAKIIAIKRNKKNFFLYTGLNGLPYPKNKTLNYLHVNIYTKLSHFKWLETIKNAYFCKMEVWDYIYSLLNSNQCFSHKTHLLRIVHIFQNSWHHRTRLCILLNVYCRVIIVSEWFRLSPERSTT